MKLPVSDVAHFDIVLNTQSEKEARDIQHIAGGIDKVPDNYCTTIVLNGTSHSK